MRYLPTASVRGMLLLVCFMHCGMGANRAAAITWHLTPKVTLDSYWDTHHICVVRVTNVHPFEIRKGTIVLPQTHVTFEVIGEISKGPMPQRRTAPLGAFRRDPSTGEPRSIDEDDVLLIHYEKNDWPAMITVTKLEGTWQESPEVAPLLRIAALRARKGAHAPLLDAVFSDDTLVANYALNRLLNVAELDSTPTFMAGLLEVRDSQSTHSRNRLVANRLVWKLRGEPEQSDHEYQWLCAAVVQSETFYDAHLFVLELLQFRHRRIDTAHFLLQVASDDTAAEHVRIAASGRLTANPLFHARTLDDTSIEIFEGAVALLTDDHPRMRYGGAHCLASICYRLAQSSHPQAPAYLERAREAVRAALAVEGDQTTRMRLGDRLQSIDKAAQTLEERRSR